MEWDFVPLGDIENDPDAIVARLRSIAGEDQDMLKSASDNLTVAGDDMHVTIWKKGTRRLRGEGSPHGGKRK